MKSYEQRTSTQNLLVLIKKCILHMTENIRMGITNVPKVQHTIFSYENAMFIPARGMWGALNGVRPRS